MEFIRNSDDTITVSSEKKEIILTDNIRLDGLLIDFPGEYEKSGFLMYVREYEGVKFFHFRAEGYWIGYAPELGEDIDADTLDFFGQLDILVSPLGKKHQKVLEKIEPRMLITYGDLAHEMVVILGDEELQKGKNYKLKSGDISTEKTSLVILED